MPIATTDKFFAVLEKSRLLSQDELVAARELVAAANGKAADATAAARVLARENMLTRWQAGQLLAGRSTFYLGKYKLIDLLGRGGMGSVFLGEHVMMNRRVAIKVLAKQIGKEPGSLERFLAEARAIAALDHPNIVHAYNVDQEGDRYYIVMEYVDGADLQRIVEKEGPLDFARAADYIRQASDGLAHAHTQKIVHCDIKPSNLVVNVQGAVKILDMGLARLLGRDQPAAEQADESVVGSVDYQAPEQALESADFDHRADLYSLGCTLYYLLTGRPPFPEGTLPERIVKHQTEQPKAIVELRKDAPAELIAVCEKMMAKDPAERYQSGEDVSAALAGLRLAIRKTKRAAPLKKAEAIAEEAAAGPVVVTNGARRKKPASAPAAAAATTPEDDEDETAAKSHKAAKGNMLSALWATSQGKAILIGSGVIAVLFLVVVSVVIGMLLGGSGGKKGEPKQHATAVTPIDDESLERQRQALKPEAIDTQLDRVPRAVARATPEAPPVKNEPPKPNENEPKANPDVPAATPQEPPKTEPPKAKPEEPKQETHKPAPPKPPQPSKAKPFDNVAKSVELPKVPKEGAEAAPVPLGAVKLDGKPLELQLIGGEVAKSHQFKLAAAEAGKTWTIAEEMKGERVDVAQVKLEGENLAVRWLPGAATIGPRANQIRNCGLTLTSGGASHFVALNQPLPVPPIVLDFNAARPRPIALKLETNPEPALVRLQVTKLDGTALKPEYKPAAIISAPVIERGKTDTSKSEMHIVLKEKPDPKDPRGFPIVVRVALAAPAGKFTLRVEPHFEGPDTSLQPLRLDAVDQSRAYFKNVQAQADAAAKKNINKQANEAQAKDAKLAAEHMTALFGFGQSLQSTKIHYRVYLDVNGQQIELASTEAVGAEPAKNAAPEPSGDDLNLDDDPKAPKRFFSGDKPDDKKPPPKK